MNIHQLCISPFPHRISYHQDHQDHQDNQENHRAITKTIKMRIHIFGKKVSNFLKNIFLLLSFVLIPASAPTPFSTLATLRRPSPPRKSGDVAMDNNQIHFHHNITATIPYHQRHSTTKTQTTMATHLQALESHELNRITAVMPDFLLNLKAKDTSPTTTTTTTTTTTLEPEATETGSSEEHHHRGRTRERRGYLCKRIWWISPYRCRPSKLDNIEGTVTERQPWVTSVTATKWAIMSDN